MSNPNGEQDLSVQMLVNRQNSSELPSQSNKLAKKFLSLQFAKSSLAQTMALDPILLKAKIKTLPTRLGCPNSRELLELLPDFSNGEAASMVEQWVQKYHRNFAELPSHDESARSQRVTDTNDEGPEGDEYLPREYDEAGERKVCYTGQLCDGRDYRCRTFFLPGRGDKLFMLATDCARILLYRDSYLLFNKNRSLYKITISQAEKDDLIRQEILPFSYRPRQIAVVTAKSVFRQFGSRIIVNGRRVRDDYWEEKARKQGFTEEDLAGEKRPGARKARDAAATDAAARESNASAFLAPGNHRDIIYARSFAQNSVPTLPSPQSRDMHLSYSTDIQHPGHPLTGQAYQDSSQARQDVKYEKQVDLQKRRSNNQWWRKYEPLKMQDSAWQGQIAEGSGVRTYPTSDHQYLLADVDTGISSPHKKTTCRKHEGESRRGGINRRGGYGKRKSSNAREPYQFPRCRQRTVSWLFIEPKYSIIRFRRRDRIQPR